ncbi:unnamed protein product [Hyaloperonospora brassicae]|uniref:Plastocyanin-like domain-containing protein n=1 Tax=Hyaloperonospora brassicae TaxID=162125 RepID=A0AAV0TG77_HYABA|nr:unnamed protein product [Hyaloperonospora brassicae]
MRASVFLEGIFFSVALDAITALHDYQALRQPTIYESDCVKQWTKLKPSGSAGAYSEMEDLPTAKNGTGELQVKLSVQVKRFTSDYVDFTTRSYNGLLPGPAIKVCPGDRLVVTLVNLLGAGTNNNTNLHVHGMHVSPMGDADNVAPIVEPRGQRKYVYDIGPDHPAGTFWYHSHSHGNVNSQLNGMMAGALIVADRPADFSTDLAAMDDLVMILQAVCVENCHNVHDDIQYAIENTRNSSSSQLGHVDTLDKKSQTRTVWMTDLEIAEDDADVPLNDTSLPTVFVNGQYLPTLDLLVGEYKRLRLINAIANNIIELVVSGDSSCALYVLAMDGIYFNKPKAKDVVVIPPGGRADVAITCADSGEFYLETDCASSRNELLGRVNQHRIPSQRIVTIKVSEEDEDSDASKRFVATTLVSTLPKRPSYMENTIGSANSASTIAGRNKYDFEFSVWMEKGMMMYGVNHKKLDMTYINHSMPVNELQEWRLSVRDYRKPEIWSCDADSGSAKSSQCRTMNHPFHIHSTHFQVSDMDTDTDPDGEMFEVGEWRDTLPLFRGKVWIRFTPRDHMVGNILAHCHMASHGDAGMSQLVKVYARPDKGEEGEGGGDASTSDSDEDKYDTEGMDDSADAAEIDTTDEDEVDSTSDAGEDDEESQAEAASESDADEGGGRNKNTSDEVE